jgi:hypothetical protein
MESAENHIYCSVVPPFEMCKLLKCGCTIFFRYLYKTFQRAFYHVQPHVVVFLGDIMDEGSIATNDEYRRYIERFNDVFNVNHRVKVSTTADTKTLVFNRLIYLWHSEHAADDSGLWGCDAVSLS